MQNSNNDYKPEIDPKAFQISGKALLLNVLGMLLVVFAGYEIYANNQKGGGFLSEAIAWHYYPWILMVIGILLMIPFHKQVRRAKKYIKQKQQELNDRNRPDF